MNSAQLRRARAALASFAIETPSWGFADTGTRFGKFFQDASAIDLGDKLADAGHVHALTGCCPTVAVHVLWDFPNGLADCENLDGYACCHAPPDTQAG